MILRRQKWRSNQSAMRGEGTATGFHCVTKCNPCLSSLDPQSFAIPFSSHDAPKDPLGCIQSAAYFRFHCVTKCNQCPPWNLLSRFSLLAKIFQAWLLCVSLDISVCMYLWFWGDRNEDQLAMRLRGGLRHDSIVWQSVIHAFPPWIHQSIASPFHPMMHPRIPLDASSQQHISDSQSFSKRQRQLFSLFMTFLWPKARSEGHLPYVCM